VTVGQVLLVATLAVPAVGAAAAALLPSRTARLTGTGAAALAFLASLPLYRSGGDPPWHELRTDWVPGLDLQFHIGVDGISYPLLVLTTLLTLLCCVYTAWRGESATLIALLLAVEVGIVGTFLALDLVLFFVFFEVVLLPMYAIIAGWGGTGRRAAARKFVLYTLLGSVLLLVGVFLVVANAGTADMVALTQQPPERSTQLIAFTFFALAFAVKSPLWPLHSWLPDAHTEAPTVGSVILAGVLLKMGTYGLIRVGVGVTPEGAAWAAPALGVLAVAAILIGALVCLAQTELKRLIAYSSVGHMGFVLLGIASLSAAGLQAALIGNIAHGLITGLLFFLAGAIKERAGTGELARLGGLRETAPRLAGVLGFAAIASLGLPGLAGFWGEVFAVVGSVQRGGPLWTTLGVIAAGGAALTTAYFLRLLRRVSHGAPVPVDPPGLARAELVAWAPLIGLTLVLGLVPVLVLGMAYDPVGALVGR
jgi:NADH-quinone oxidoreductase subunit M